MSGRDGQENKLRGGQNCSQNNANTKAKTQVRFSNFMGENCVEGSLSLHHFSGSKCSCGDYW